MNVLAKKDLNLKHKIEHKNYNVWRGSTFHQAVALPVHWFTQTRLSLTIGLSYNLNIVEMLAQI